jgi:spoIIIJ-associated protein
MSIKEYEGRSAAEAAIKACDELGVPRSALKYEVVSETGEDLDKRVVIKVDVGAVEASPRADEHPVHRADDDDREDDRGPRRRGRRGGRGRRDDRDGSRGRRSRGGRDGGRRGDRSGRDGGRRGGRGGRSRGPREARPDNDGIEAMLNLEPIPSEPIPERPELEGEVSARAQAAREIVGQLLEKMGLEMEPRLVQDGEEEIHFDLIGGEAVRVIGKKGEALLALQFLANRILARRETEGGQHVVLDAAGYRQRRRDALVGLAEQLAARAMEENKVVRLSPMSAHDRRVFHLALAEKDGVTTRSEGSGLFRPLLIIPGEE